MKEQSPLPPVASSAQTAASATSELANFANASNIQYFSYGRKTAKGIVMDLVVDELFPDRRRRQSLLSPEAEDTGVACKPDPRYAKVCAIAFSDSPITKDVAQTNSDASNNSDVAVAKPEASTPPDNEVAKQPQAAPKPGNDTANDSEPAPKPAPEPPVAPKAAPTPPSAENTNEVATGSLPVPPQPQAPPTASPSSELQSDEQTKADAEADRQIAQTKLEIEAEQNKLPDINNEQEAEIVPEADDSETAVSNDDGQADESKEVEEEAAVTVEQEDISEETTPEAVANNDAETEVKDDSEQVAINSENAGIQERVERGALEDGDRVIEDDGSLYDFYPIEGKKGDSLTINLASDEFDAFVALVDSNGNTVDENDDISQSDSNSEIKVTLPADGVYNVIVNTYDEQGKGEYVLTVGQ